MRIDIITIFPEIFTPLDVSIVKKAKEKRLVEIVIWNLRNFSKDKHKKVDDKAYGGGKGMVLKCQPI
ncbi:MAG: tRNA (guanosine(37)-N1)-methyltransferase TrmD, partial [bacterium]|nr:tRNA (guanosine(37)-N1)-methyltransferase TrmD [bacterium]MDW8164134.1 tRNA (guanosine(37)-N1)-methyltransferase TrmD [Candidatus Omnitrophota bacterium]